MKRTILLLLLLAGCATQRSVLPRDPSRAANYARLESVPIDFAVQAEVGSKGFLEMFLKGVEKLQADPKALSEFVQRIRRMLNNQWIDWEALQKRMQKGDVLCYFEYKDKNYTDYGVAVVRDGRVLYRRPIGTSLWNFEVDGVQYKKAPFEAELDKL